MSFLYSPSAGTTIAVTITSTPTTIPGVEAVPEFGAEKGTYEVTAIDDVAKKYGADLPDYGEISLQGTYDSTETTHAYLQTSASSANAVEIFTVTFAKKQGAATAAKGVFSGLVLSFKVSATKNKQQMFTSKVKLTGAVTWTAAA